MRLLMYLTDNYGLFIAEIGNKATEYAYITKTSLYVNIMTLIFDIYFVNQLSPPKCFAGFKCVNPCLQLTTSFKEGEDELKSFNSNQEHLSLNHSPYLKA